MFDELFPKEVGDVPCGVVDHGCTSSEGDSEELVEGACPYDVVPGLERRRASRNFMTGADGGVGLDKSFEVFSRVAVSGGELGKSTSDRAGEFLEPVMWLESWLQVRGNAVRPAGLIWGVVRGVFLPSVKHPLSEFHQVM